MSAEAMREAADYLDQYAQFIREDVKVVDIERHPYVPALEAAAEALRAFPIPSPWRTIDSAPRNRGIILGRPGKVLFGKWYDDNVPGFYSGDVGSDDICPDRPATHWMERPAAPDAGGDA